MLPAYGNEIAEKAAEGTVSIVKSLMDREGNMQRLKNELQKLRCIASDIEEKQNRALSSGKKKKKSEVENWFDEEKKIQTEFDQLQTRAPEGMGRYLPIEDPIGKMLCKVRELIEQSHHFNGLVLDDSDNIGELCSPTKLFGEKFERDLERIWPCLVTDDISNIGIHGMGGVGKTTLVRRIEFNLLQEKYRVFWVTVSQEFSIKSLQDKIANVLGLSLSNKDEEEKRARILRRAMSERGKFVLILDDVWDDFRVEKVGISLGANKCRLILTTRSKDVCNRMHCQREFEVKTLDTNASWELFKHTLGCKVPAGVEEIAKSVTKECAGLPLGIVTLAGSMTGIEDIQEWRNALDQLKECSKGHEKMERDVFPILEWSFNRLNKCQKHCFLYCALFPGDWKIETEQLVNLFIGAELMRRRDTRQSEFDEGHTILNQLVRVGLLEKTSNREAREYVQMHDLIRDMAIRITSGEFVQKINDVPRFLVKSNGVQQKEWTEDLDAVSIWYMKEEIPSDMSPKCPKLSTLLLRNGNIKTIPDSFFRHMGGLMVLNLMGCSYLTELPTSVSEMVNLTALILRGCEELEHVPPLGKLKQLRELNLSGSGIKHIPKGLEELVRLESLEMDGNLEKEIPADMSPKCPKLLTLLFRDGKIKTIPDSFFRHMGGLKVLNLEGCTYLTELPNCLEMVNLTALILQGCENLAYVPPLGKLKQLRELNLSHSGIKHLPEGLKELINLESLEMVWTNLKEEIIPKGTLSELYRLKQLKLPLRVQVCDPEVLNQLDVFHGLLSFIEICEPFKISRWPKHYALLVEGCCSVDSDWDEFLLDADARDKNLVFYGCNFRRGLDAASLPKDIQYLEFNECVVEQSDVFQILNSSNDLLHLTINSSKGVEFLLKASSPPPLDSELIAIPYAPLQNLKTLHLDDLPDLVGFFDYKLPLAPGTFSSLKSVRIQRCHKMRKLFTVQLLQSLKKLKKLQVKCCKGLEEFIEADEEEVRGSPSTSSGPTNTLRKLPLPPGTFSSLEFIMILGCDKMTKLFTVQLLQNLKNLQSLSVMNCKEVEEIIPADEEDARGSGPTNTLTLPQIYKLSLCGMPRLKNICKATIICNSIQKITVLGCPNVKRLPLFLPINGGQPSPPNTLKYITGEKKWWESLEWNDPNDKITLHPFFKERLWF